MTRCGFTCRTGLALAALALAGLLAPAQAQDLRDPTIPPSAGGAAPGASAQSSWGGEGGMSVIVRDGKAGLVVGTRVVQPGQKVGPWNLERITETEVWLRNGATLRKVSRFSGIQRHDPALVPVCPAPASAQAKTAKIAKATPASPASPKVDPQCDAPLTRSSNP